MQRTRLLTYRHLTLRFARGEVVLVKKGTTGLLDYWTGLLDYWRKREADSRHYHRYSLFF